jgi:hypothetical protein
MPFVNLESIEEKETVPGYHARMVHSDNMTFAYWWVEAGASLLEHSYHHELEWEDIDITVKTLRVKRQLVRKRGGGFNFTNPKTSAGKRSIALGLATTEILKEHHKAQYQEMVSVGDLWQGHDLVFPSIIGTPMNHTHLSR